MMRFESLGQHWHRKPRKPLASFIDLCDLLNIEQAKLRGLMARHNGPKPVLNHKNSQVKAKWYDKDEFIRWWRSLDVANG